MLSHAHIMNFFANRQNLIRQQLYEQQTVNISTYMVITLDM